MNVAQRVQVLLVEDDEDDFLLTRDLLSQATGVRFGLEWAPTYEAACEAVRAGVHDVYLVDYQLGERTGLELLREVGSGGAPVILLTGHGSHGIDVEAARAGAADYLPKHGLDAVLLERSIRYALERARLLRREREAVRARDEVLGFVAHDLRNSVAVVSLSAQILQEMEATEEFRLKQLQIVERTAEWMDRLIEDLLSVTQVEAGALSLETAPLDVDSLLEEVRQIMAAVASAREIRLEVDVAGDPPPVLADHARILQVCSNLVGNAIKFTPRGGAVCLRAESVNDTVLFSVADTGDGIPEEDLPHLFDRFWQARHARRGGAGLGLAISKGIVEAHRGEIRVESTVGSGSTFFFTLRAA